MIALTFCHNSHIFMQTTSLKTMPPTNIEVQRPVSVAMTAYVAPQMSQLWALIRKTVNPAASLPTS